ncbi:MAG: hypothetical protein AAFR20_10710 [Pseudomonadota bacterium]
MNSGSFEGKVGLQGGGIYAAYFCDPNGNTLNAYDTIAALAAVITRILPSRAGAAQVLRSGPVSNCR